MRSGWLRGVPIDGVLDETLYITGVAEIVDFYEGRIIESRDVGSGWIRDLSVAIISGNADVAATFLCRNTEPLYR